MTDDDSILGQNLVDVRNEARRNRMTDVYHCDDPEGDWIRDQQEDDFGQEWDCTHCGGEGTCDANANPLWDCDDNPHPCHACAGSGLRRDQRIF